MTTKRLKAIALAIVLIIMFVNIVGMQIRINDLTMEVAVNANRITNLINSQPEIADDFNHLLGQMEDKSQNTIMRCICVTSKRDAECRIYDYNAGQWLSLLTKVYGGNCSVHGMDMTIFNYTPSDDIVYPDEVQDYIEENSGRRISSCSHGKDDYNFAFFAKNLPVMLHYKQQWDGGENGYSLKIKMYCEENSERVIDFEIEGASNAKLVYSEKEVEGVGRELLVFCIGDKYYCINRELMVFEIAVG